MPANEVGLNYSTFDTENALPNLKFKSERKQNRLHNLVDSRHKGTISHSHIVLPVCKVVSK